MSESEQHLTAYNGQLWCFQVHGIETYGHTTLTCSRRDFSAGTPCESSATVTNSLIIAHPYLCILACETVTEFRTNSRKLFVLLGEIKNTSINLKLIFVRERGMDVFLNLEYSSNIDSQPIPLLLTPNQSADTDSCNRIIVKLFKESLSPCKETVTQKPSPTMVAILDGPNVCISFKNRLYFTHPDSDSSSFSQCVVDIHTDSPGLLGWSLIWSTIDLGYFTALLSVDRATCDALSPMQQETKLTQEFVVFTLQCNGGKDKALQNINAKTILPNEYADILSCISVLSLSRSDHDNCIKNTSTVGPNKSDQMPVHSQVLICTKESQLLHLENGKVKDFTCLPFSNGKSISKFESATGLSYIGVHSDEHTYCIVDEEQFCVCFFVANSPAPIQ